jgi:hypothetical protein
MSKVKPQHVIFALAIVGLFVFGHLFQHNRNDGNYSANPPASYQ